MVMYDNCAISVELSDQGIINLNDPSVVESSDPSVVKRSGRGLAPPLQYTGFAVRPAKPVRFIMAHRYCLVHLGLG